jgi:hypothetical protein
MVSLLLFAVDVDMDMLPGLLTIIYPARSL